MRMDKTETCPLRVLKAKCWSSPNFRKGRKKKKKAQVSLYANTSNRRDTTADFSGRDFPCLYLSKIIKDLFHAIESSNGLEGVTS